MGLIENERTKLTANAFDRFSTTVIAVGAVAPVAALLYSPSGAKADLIHFVGPFLWFAAGIMVHLAARYVLRGLK